MTFELKQQSPISIGQRVDLLATEIEIAIDGMLLRKLDGGAVPRQQYPTLNRIANAEAIRRNYGWFKNEYWDQRDGRHLRPSGAGSLIQRCGYWNNKTGANRKFVIGNTSSRFISGNETSVTETTIGFYQNIYYASQADRWFWQGSNTLQYSSDINITALTTVTSPMSSTAYSMYEVPATGTLLASWSSPNDTIARSVDGGDTWSTVSINWPVGIIGQGVRQTIADVDGIIGAFATNRQGFIKSQDDGLTWSGVSGSSDVPRSLNAMDVNPETNTVVMAGSNYMYRGSNGFSGAITEVSSVNLPLSSFFTAYDVKFIGSNTWVVVGASGLFWMSVDDGLTFTEIQGAEYYVGSILAGILTTSNYGYTIVYDTSGNAVVRIDPGSNFMAIPQVRADTPGFNSYVRVR
jgi:hypothetical protein